MKNTRIFTFLVILLCSLTTWAASPKREFRATWVTTAASIDWPKYKARNETGRKAQQLELTYIFDELVKSNMNAVCLQVRGRSDAFYKSSYEPWSQDLTDTRGQDPGYDPLAFAIEEAHKRGLELHVGQPLPSNYHRFTTYIRQSVPKLQTMDLEIQQRFV